CSGLAKNLAVNGAVTGGSDRDTGWTVDEGTINKPVSLQAIDPATGTALYLSATATVDVVKVSTSYP
ncbi:hypothetical protein, partial [Mesorhizobium sp. GbtcB19]|uniref:hypothetical protein n=1 Tax=Mesorhizobium sp. GbtcB19 TaxID=2824764 RepID=UPI001C30FD0E